MAKRKLLMGARNGEFFLFFNYMHIFGSIPHSIRKIALANKRNRHVCFPKNTFYSFFCSSLILFTFSFCVSFFLRSSLRTKKESVLFIHTHVMICVCALGFHCKPCGMHLAEGPLLQKKRKKKRRMPSSHRTWHVFSVQCAYIPLKSKRARAQRRRIMSGRAGMMMIYAVSAVSA